MTIKLKNWPTKAIEATGQKFNLRAYELWNQGTFSLVAETDSLRVHLSEDFPSMGALVLGVRLGFTCPHTKEGENPETAKALIEAMLVGPDPVAELIKP